MLHNHGDAIVAFREHGKELLGRDLSHRSISQRFRALELAKYELKIGFLRHGCERILVARGLQHKTIRGSSNRAAFVLILGGSPELPDRSDQYATLFAGATGCLSSHGQLCNDKQKNLHL